MPDTRRAVLVCLSGYDTAGFLTSVRAHVSTESSLVLLYVVDTRPEERVADARRKLHGGGGPFARMEERMASASDETADLILDEAIERCTALGWEASAIQRRVARGHPEREIIHIAESPGQNIGLIAIGASHRGHAKPRKGPKSVGHVARFVLDHSPCDVLLLR